MTSAINYSSINENFPVAGQDNDTQVFRDNFNTIKNSLRSAQSEITDLQDNTARTDSATDFNLKELSRAVLKNNWDYVAAQGTTSSDMDVSPSNGPYQVWTIGGSVNVNFSEFPTNSDTLLGPVAAAKVTLEFYGGTTESPVTLTFVSTGGTVFKKNNWPDATNTLELTSTTDPVIIEVWQRSTDRIFLNYVGQFS